MGFVGKIIIYFPRFFLSPTDDLFLTERTEFTDFLSLRDVFFRPQITQIEKIFFFSFFWFARFRLRLKHSSTDWHRFLPGGIYISLIFFSHELHKFYKYFLWWFVIFVGFVGKKKKSIKRKKIIWGICVICGWIFMVNLW